MKNRFVVIGVDGATFEIIQPLIEQQKLPNLKYLMKNGFFVKLRSIFPVNSPQAWSSIATGKNPGKHGIYHFTEKIPHQYGIRFVNASLRDGKPLWRLLSEQGKKVIAINVPITYPPEEIDGVMVSGFDTPGIKNDYTYPSEIRNDIENLVGEYIIDLRLRNAVTHDKRDYVLRNLRLMEEKRLRIIKYLMKKYDWDFIMIVFSAADRVQHWFWKYMDIGHLNHDANEDERYKKAIYDIYQFIDTLIGELVDELDNHTSIAVVSDHGFQRATNKVFYINKWLKELGMLNLTDEANNSNIPIRGAVSELIFQNCHKLKSYLARLLPRQYKSFLKKTFPGLRSRVFTYLTFSRIDWSRTRAFSSEFYNSIYINLKGREIVGIVQEGEEYRSVISLLTEELYKLKDPQTGERIIENVYKAEDLYHGPNLSRAPDLLFTFKNGEYRVRQSHKVLNNPHANFLGEYASETWASGKHHLDGIIILSGMNIRRDGQLIDPTILDITPTVLYALGCKIPSDIDGRVLEEAFHESFLKLNKLQYLTEVDDVVGEVDYKDIYSPEESKQITERLRGLGYIE